MSVMGPVFVQTKSSASHHGPSVAWIGRVLLSQTSSPPSRFGHCTYLKPLVSTHCCGGLVEVVSTKAKSSCCWVVGSYMGVQLPAGMPAGSQFPQTAASLYWRRDVFQPYR